MAGPRFKSPNLRYLKLVVSVRMLNRGLNTESRFDIGTLSHLLEGSFSKHFAKDRLQLYLAMLAVWVQGGELVPGHQRDTPLQLHHRAAVQRLRGRQRRVA